MSIRFLNTLFPNSIILASSPLTETAEHIKKGEEYGAGGAILKTCCYYARKKEFDKRKVLFTSDRKSYYASSSFDREILTAGYIFPIISRAGIKGVSLLDSIRVPVTDTPDGFSLPFSTTSLFGEWQLPISLRYTYIAKQYGLAVCGGGGVSNRSSVMQMISAGADLVQIASAILLNGYDYLQHLQPNEKISQTSPQAKFPTAYQIKEENCSHCQLCIQSAWCGAISLDSNGVPFIHKELCDTCGWCAARCPSGAIERT